MPTLLDPIQIGSLKLKNRIFMAPLTRCRANNPGRVPNDLMVEYYTQRSSAGLILTEATSISPMGLGYEHTPGIWSNDQIQGWKKITDSVHQSGGVIFLQLWHVGRISDPYFLDGKIPVAPSAIAASGSVNLLRPKRNFVTPRALDLNEISGIVESYKQAAINAKLANFDGVEIHGANGYLLDQFLQDGSNKRSDQYGGNIENRARLHLEVTDAICTVWPSDRVGMHLAPRCDTHSMGDSDPLKTFSYLVSELSQRKIGFICAREHLGEGRIGNKLRKLFSGAYIVNESIDFQMGQKILADGEADAVAFGRAFIANPDLPVRFAKNLTLNTPKPESFYGQGPEGYTDYSFIS